MSNADGVFSCSGCGEPLLTAAKYRSPKGRKSEIRGNCPTEGCSFHGHPQTCSYKAPATTTQKATTFKVTFDLAIGTNRTVLDFGKKHKGIQNGDSFVFESFENAQNFALGVRSYGVECSVPVAENDE
jgi:hypothetical protein